MSPLTDWLAGTSWYSYLYHIYCILLQESYTRMAFMHTASLMLPAFISAGQVHSALFLSIESSS